jgi:hypothetical protein
VQALHRRPFLRPFLYAAPVQLVPDPARRAWKLEVEVSLVAGPQCARRRPPSNVKSFLPQHFTALHFFCTTKSTQQTQHIIAPTRLTRAPHASRCATCCAAAAEHCIRYASTRLPPRLSLSPSPHRCPPSIARCSRPALRARLSHRQILYCALNNLTTPK